MMLDAAKDTIQTVLENLESAPSARCLVQSILVGPLSEEQEAEIYELSEGENDSAIRKMLVSCDNQMSLLQLQTTLLEIALEKISHYEEENVV